MDSKSDNERQLRARGKQREEKTRGQSNATRGADKSQASGATKAFDY